MTKSDTRTIEENCAILGMPPFRFPQVEVAHPAVSDTSFAAFAFLAIFGACFVLAFFLNW